MRINTFFSLGIVATFSIFLTFQKEAEKVFYPDLSFKNAKSYPLALQDYDYAKYYLVIADTGHSFALLHKTMFALSNNTGLEIDTMGRIYDSKTNKIILPYDDSDEMYAGYYFPRRFPSQNLSMEYLNFYFPNSDTGTIAVLAGIFEEKKKADSLLKVIKPYVSSAYVKKASVYVGCMH